MSGTLVASGKDELKASIRLLKKKPMNCAIGDIGKIAEMRLHPTKQPTTLLAELRHDDPKVVKPACGLAFVPQKSPHEVRLDMRTKPASGICKRLAVRLRGTGLRKVILLVAGKHDDEYEVKDDAAAAEPSGAAEEEDAPAPVPGDLAALKPRITAAAQAIGRLNVHDPRGTAARGLLTDIVAGFKVGNPAISESLVRLEKLVASEPKPSMQATGPDPREVLQATITNAYTDIYAARSLPNGEVAELERTISELMVTGKSGRHDEALALARKAQSQAVEMNGEARRMEQQKSAYGQVKPVIDKVLTTYLKQDAVESAQKLHPGETFQGFVDALGDCAASKTAENCDALIAAADRYIAHYKNDLNFVQRRSTEHQIKRKNAEAAKIAARHTKLALQLNALPPPPWNAEQAERFAALQAAFTFETELLTDRKTGKPLPVKAKPLGGEGGISAAFWVDGFNPALERTPDQASEAPDHVFLFKPAQGEIDVHGFPFGGSAPREAITYAAANAVQQMTGLDLACPETHLVTIATDSIDIETYNAMPKKEADAPQLSTRQGEYAGSLQQFAASKGKLADHKDTVDWAAFSTEDCHRVATLDILMLNLDRHSGNVLLSETKGQDGTGKPGLVPIDHGLTLPSLDSLETRAPLVMNNSTHGNCLLRMPNSFEPFSAATAQRLDLLDPERLATSVTAARDMLAAQHPDLQIGGTVPSANIDMVKRSAQLLKMAARALSPAVIQILIAAEWKTLFDPAEGDFEANATRLIEEYSRQAEDIRTLYCGTGMSLEQICDKLSELGLVTFQSGQTWQMIEFRSWLAKNASKAVTALRTAGVNGQP